MLGDFVRLQTEYGKRLRKLERLEIGRGWDLIQTYTVGAGGAASVTFASIPQTYRNLVLFANARSSAVDTVDVLAARFNADAGNNYDTVAVLGNNSVASSVPSLGIAQAYLFTIDAANSRANCFGGGFAKILNYTNTNFETNGHSLSGSEGTPTAATAYVTARYFHWRSSNAVTDILVFANAGNLLQNTVLQLYGIL